MSITVSLDPRSVKEGIKSADIKKCVNAVFNFLEKDKKINIVFKDQDFIKKINAEYRNKDESTDVLSFDYGDEGDIILCLSEIDKRKEDLDLKQATNRTLVHGCLHLFGFDHEKVRDYDIMTEAENNILKGLI